MGRTATRGLAAAGVTLLLAACASGAGTADTSSATGTASTAERAACEPVGADGGTEIRVALDEWSVAPDTSRAAASTITFVADNVGDEPHELVVVRGDDVDALPVDEHGALDEEALDEEALVGEIEPFPAGEDCSGTFDMPAGRYVLLCTIVEEEDGEVESHLALGMHASFEVTR